METAEELTTSGIVAQVQAQHDAPGHQDVHDDSNDEDDENGEIVPIPSMSEAVSCLEKLRVFFRVKEAMTSLTTLRRWKHSLTTKEAFHWSHKFHV